MVEPHGNNTLKEWWSESRKRVTKPGKNKFDAMVALVARSLWKKNAMPGCLAMCEDNSRRSSWWRLSRKSSLWKLARSRGSTVTKAIGNNEEQKGNHST
jgi:hypothetical protein